MRYLALLLLWPPLPLAAQDFRVDEVAVSACFETAQRGHGESGCIGQASAVCQMKSRQGMTTLGISQCNAAEAAAWDDLLNREYAATREHYADRPVLQDLIRKAQRAWIEMRDADCTLAYDRWDGGSMRVIAGSDCRLRHTARRTLDLRSMREN